MTDTTKCPKCGEADDVDDIADLLSDETGYCIDSLEAYVAEDTLVFIN